MVTLSAATATRTATTLSIDSCSQTDDDGFDDIIRGGYFDDDGDGPHDENCQFYIGECDELARFWVIGSKSKDKQFYCPKHFAMLLHDIVDAMAHNPAFAELKTPAQRRNMLHTFFLEWGRTGF
ncbi:hypothetical protein [Bifidobacterium leontopitheci]|uniref:Uncharacterized protein n=1 Tax=Bifidobacterium leontopitheci TaxID=2650774 RepID=A0A6I1GK71_9BIFI|nr:hypothetical protein [Bifidobacterium leontopitheci]KAB7790036.1 hypothetical protein F7D09_1454 [Bifidobacterium leontopitheci]